MTELLAAGQGPLSPAMWDKLVAGYDADVLLVDGDPTTDLSALTDPTNLTGIYLRGRRVPAGPPVGTHRAG